METTQASTSRLSKKPKITIIQPRQLFIDLTKDDDKTPSPKQQTLSPNAPNAPSKTPSTRDVSSSSIASKLNLSPSTFPPTNPYLSSTMSPPQRVSPPPPIHDHETMDFILTLSPITSLDFYINNSSPSSMLSPPILGHPIPFNLLKAHGKTCLW
ncbi:hypothetical protein Tco_1011320, partial [Tanacetum coccineum]